MSEIKISTDKSLLDVPLLHSFLTEIYWAKGRTIDQVRKTIEYCRCYGVYLDDKQIGFARVLSDFTVFAYLMDVFILDEYRGRGYGAELISFIKNDELLKDVPQWALKTRDAQALYAKFGFHPLLHPNRVMEI
jgi:GNAT superfamily N-acetyltransferase